MALYDTPSIGKFTVKEVLNKVINTGEDALKVDIDNVTLKTEGSDINIEVHTDKTEDSMLMFSHTVAAGTGGTSLVPLVDSDGHLQVDALSSALPSGAATAANQTTIIGHVDGIETLITSTNSKIDTFDAVLDSSLTKQGEIDTAIDSLVTANHSDLLAVEASLTSMEGKQDTQVTHLSEIEGAVEAIEGAIDGSQMQVDVVASLPAGSAAIGKLAANSGVDIGDVDVTSLPASTNTLEVVGDAAENANAAGNPVLIGGRYDNSGANDGGLRTLDTTDVGALALDPKGVLLTKDFTGQAGSILVTGTSAVAAGYGKFIAIQFIEDTVFSSSANGLSASDVNRWPDDTGIGSDISSNGAAIDGVTFPQGMTIFGRWDDFTLASGKVIAYIGYV